MIKAKDFKNRKELENFIVSEYGEDTEPKDDVISGTKKQLKVLSLSHGQSIWGVSVQATDHVETEKVRPKRGKIFDSKLNGRKVIKNAKNNKNRTKRRGS